MITPKDMAEAVEQEEAAWQVIDQLVRAQGTPFATQFYIAMTNYKRATIRRMQLMATGVKA